jgi:hypothetical protein
MGGRKWSRAHAVDSARVLSEIDPDFIRLRSLIVKNDTLLFEAFYKGEFEPLNDDEIVDEIALFIENLECHSYLVSDQMSNLLYEIEGHLPDEKEEILKRIAQYQQQPLMQKLEFGLNRRMQSYIAVHGSMDHDLQEKITIAVNAIKTNSTDARDKANQAITALKQGFI